MNTALKNANAVIFAHGAVGSGKSYTFEGSRIAKAKLGPGSGLILRAIHSLFEAIS